MRHTVTMHLCLLVKGSTIQRDSYLAVYAGIFVNLPLYILQIHYGYRPGMKVQEMEYACRSVSSDKAGLGLQPTKEENCTDDGLNILRQMYFL